MIEGYATLEGTRRYCSRFDDIASGHFRKGDDVYLSSIGLGTYLGEPDADTDESYRKSIRLALSLGCNVIDTAINYRCQRSERAIGRALAEAIEAGTVRRDEVFVSSKAGFIPFDREPPPDPPGYFRETFIDSGIMRADELIAGCHCMTPGYLEHQLECSRRNLGLETLDLYYVHNPETQLSEADRGVVYERLREAFAILEEAADNGWIRRYGIATWEGLRTEPGGRPYLSLTEVARLARQAGGENNRFRAVQLPVNLGMPEAFAQANQPVDDDDLPALAAARHYGLMAFASGSLHQGQLLGRLPPWLRRNLGEEATDAQRALQFARSCPGLTAALVGMSKPPHVEENLSLAASAPLSLQELQRILQPPAGA